MYFSRKELINKLNVPYTTVYMLHKRHEDKLKDKFIKIGKDVLYSKEGVLELCKQHFKSKNKIYNLLIYVGYSREEIFNNFSNFKNYFELQEEIKTMEDSFQYILDDESIVLIDECDYRLICDLNWKWNGRYVESLVTVDNKEKRTFMHRFLMNPIEDQVVDHINRNPFDNRRSVNLRNCSSSENRWNSRPKRDDGIKGVKLLPSGNYTATFISDGVRAGLGTFTNILAAGNMYNHYARNIRGEFAYINDIEFMSEEECLNFKVVRQGWDYKNKNPLEYI